MKTKEIESLLGVPASTFFEWNKSDHPKNALAKLLKALTVDDFKKITNSSNKKPKPIMLVSTVNCSIGDKNKHFSLISLKKIFYKNGPLTPLEKYAIKTIKKEALTEEINEFVDYYKIPAQRVNNTLALC